jgi:hypothetical protein
VSESRLEHPGEWTDQCVDLDGAAEWWVLDREDAGRSGYHADDGLANGPGLVHEQHPLAVRLRNRARWRWKRERRLLGKVVELEDPLDDTGGGSSSDTNRVVAG